jgi:phosphatidylserine/phosphatidylglycerophosphate/cardiolipin synthase-like enzyme
MTSFAKAHFTSLDGGKLLRSVILGQIREALRRAKGGSNVGLDIMAFSFTDAEIANALIDAASATDRLRVRLIADWHQGGRDPAKQARRLTAAGRAHLAVRYTLDQPYYWDPDLGLARWSFAASAGLFHHKTLLTVVDDTPCHLILGSFNWTKKALSTSENLIVLDGRAPEASDAIRAMSREFSSIWQDRNASLSPSEAEAWFLDIVAAFASGNDPPVPPAFARHGAAAPCSRGPTSGPSRVALAFSAPRDRCDSTGNAAHCLDNATRSFPAEGPKGVVDIPLTLANLVKTVLNAARSGEEVCVAAFALSRRSPEYNALLQAARRGVRFRVLLTHGRAAGVGNYLVDRSRREDLQVAVRTARRPMHQKYLLHRRSATVVTGTANFTPDAHTRHYESRLYLRHCGDICDRFARDFDTLWQDGTAWVQQ